MLIVTVTVLVLLLACGLYLLQAAISDQPWVAAPTATTPQQVYQVKALAKRTLKAFDRPHASSIIVNQAELESLTSLMARAYPQLHSQLTIDAQGLQVSSSLALPNNPFGRYLSLRLRLPVSPQQLQIKQLQLGTAAVPDQLLQPLVPWVLALLFDQDQRQILRQTLRLIAAAPDRLAVSIHPPVDASHRLRQLLLRIQSFSGDKPALDRALISHYYGLLQQQSKELQPKQWISLTYFIAPLFRHVAQQAAPEQRHLHSAAALLALAIYLGSDRFEQLTGPVLSDRQRQQRSHYRTLLRGRIDLRQHFVVSAALQVLADAGFSQAIGEFKELLDSGQGGSGFSFADLAADRAGTLFALRASRNPQQATALLQQFDVPLREPDLMIAIDQLPEGLTEAQFQRNYRNLDSAAYRQTVDRIDSELAKLRLYR